MASIDDVKFHGTPNEWVGGVAFRYNPDNLSWDAIRKPTARADLDNAAFTAGEIKELITAVALKKFRIHWLQITVSGATLVTIQDDAGTPEIYMEYEFAGAGHLVVPLPEEGMRTITANKALDVKSSGAVNVGVHGLYSQEA